MRGPFLLVVLVGIAPLLIFALVVAGTGLRVAEWQPPNMWNAQFGVPNTENSVTALSSDATGFYAAGVLNATSIAAGPSLFVAKYTLNGNEVWMQQNRVPYSAFDSIASGTDGVYTSGFLNGTAVVLKYDLNGNQIWTNRFGEFGVNEVTGVSVGASGVYASAIVDNGNGTLPVVLREYDFGGNIVWTRSLGNSDATGAGIYANSKGVYFTGVVNGSALVRKYDPDGTFVWSRVIDSSSTMPCPCSTAGIAGDASGIVVAGNYNIPKLEVDGFLRKYDTDGNTLWTVRFSALDHSGIVNLAVSANSSGSYLAETTGINTFVLKYDANGDSVWSFQMRTLSHRDSRSLAIGVGENSVYVGGSLGTDAYIAGFSQSSSLILFGLNPPFSFALAGLIVSLATVGFLWLRRRIRKKMRLSSANRSRSTRPPVLYPLKQAPQGS